MNLKYMKNLLGITGCSDNCALICQADDSSQQQPNASIDASQMTPNSSKMMHQIQYAIVLCNLIGTPLEYKYIDFLNALLVDERLTRSGRVQVLLLLGTTRRASTGTILRSSRSRGSCSSIIRMRRCKRRPMIRPLWPLDLLFRYTWNIKLLF